MKLKPVVVFCHNDVQEGKDDVSVPMTIYCSFFFWFIGNLLHTESEEGNPIQMIDFEYSSYNYRSAQSVDCLVVRVYSA